MSIIMAKGSASKCLFYFLLSVLTLCSCVIRPVRAGVPDVEAFEPKEEELQREEERIFFYSSHRSLLSWFNYRTVSHDANNLPTIVTVPSSNPAGLMPSNPAATTTPAAIPGAPPLTNPATATPTPGVGSVPVTPPPAPVVSPPVAIPPPTSPVVSPPAATSGQSWCVAKSGVPQTALQSALDYACGRADCSAIQPSGNCYNPNTLQNHASYAFNSYYQKNPGPTSCDFGGTASLVNANPGGGSCVFQSSSSSSTSTITPPSSATPTTTPPPGPPSTPTTTPPPGPPSSTLIPPPSTTTPPPSLSGSGSSPMVLNSSNPASATSTVFGSESPPPSYNSASPAPVMRPLFVSYLILVTSIYSHWSIRF